MLYLLFLFTFIHQICSSFSELLSFKIEIDHIIITIRSITNNAFFSFSFYFFESFSRKNMTTFPKSNKFIKPIVLELCYGTSNEISTFLGCSLDLDLKLINIDTFLRSLSFLMYEYLVGKVFFAHADKTFSKM